MKNVFECSLRELREWLAGQREKDYRLQQIVQWLLPKKAEQFSSMTNLSRSLQLRLAESFSFNRPSFGEVLYSRDGTGKGIVELFDDNRIESVLIPDTDRITVCISTQVGCKYHCRFCVSGSRGLVRNLSALEIAGQVVLWQSKGFTITNVVMMGIGEPMDNLEQVIDAHRLLNDAAYLGFSHKKITISTVGLLPQLDQLLVAVPKPKIAISLHSAIQEKRKDLIPIGATYSVDMIHDWIVTRDLKYPVTLQYAVMPGINNGPSDRDALVKFCRDLPNVKVNLIPYNRGLLDIPEPTETEIAEFGEYLVSRQVRVLIRKTRGRDIQGACGQLVGAVLQR